MSPHVSPPQAPPPHAWAAALHRSAQPLIALATQLRTAVPAHPAETLSALSAAVARFERELAQAGGDTRTVTAASYLLCVWLDEVITPHAWAAADWPSKSLLLQFHGEPDGRTRVFQLLDRLMQQPVTDRPLLELFHVCLSLGLQGRWQDTANGPRELAALRTRLAGLLHLSATPLAVPLSQRWQPAVAERKAWQGRHVVMAGLTLTALTGLGVYSSSQWLLARQADQVFASLQGLERAGRAAPAPAVAPIASGRMATALAADVAAGRLSVRDEAHRSQITLAADGLFQPGTTNLATAQLPLLERIAQALTSGGGTVLVTSYARPDAARSARLASASQLADEWARRVAQVLAQRLPAGSVASEGRVLSPVDAAVAGAGARAAPDTNTAGRRNVIEITLFP